MFRRRVSHSSDPFRPQSRDTARHFSRLYTTALSLIAGLAIVGQILVQRSLISQQSGGHVVNMAGYQRMLSQRITLKVILYDGTQSDARAQIRAIEVLRDRWVAAHAELVAQVDPVAFGGTAQTALARLLDDLRQPLLRISAQVDTLANKGSLTASERSALLTDQEIFLPLMDAVVLGFEQSVRGRVAFLQGVELALLILTLVVLALEAALIFRPAVQRLRASLEQLEQRGQQSAKRLESLRHLAGGIAHNFNNILTAVQGHAELQRLDAVAARQSTEYIDAQINGCRRAADIVVQLLNYSGYGRFDRESTTLGPWLAALTKSLAPEGSPVALEVEVVEDAVAAVDRKAITQAVDGLVANAIEAMAGQGGKVVVKLLQASLTEPRLMSGPYRAELPPGLYACIRVIDQGEGITAEEAERIFDPYHTRKQFGRGLGLAAILGVAHGHGGGIEVESRLGRGSTVSLYLPIMEAGTARSVTYSAPV